jgi:phage tail-like protein
MAASTGVLFDHLPAVYQEQAGPLAPFLDACEAILLGGGGTDAASQRGLGASISKLHTLLDPGEAPEAFLRWLAGWVSLDLRGDLEESRKRELLARIVALYSWRGTRKGLEDLLALLTGGRPVISEPESTTLEVGSALVGSTTRLGSRPFYFEVRLELPASADSQTQARVEEMAREVIDLEKPAHTYYSLEVAAAAGGKLTDGH